MYPYMLNTIYALIFLGCKMWTFIFAVTLSHITPPCHLDTRYYFSKTNQKMKSYHLTQSKTHALAVVISLPHTPSSPQAIWVQNKRSMLQKSYDFFFLRHKRFLNSEYSEFCLRETILILYTIHEQSIEHVCKKASPYSCDCSTYTNTF